MDTCARRHAHGATRPALLAALGVQIRDVPQATGLEWGQRLGLGRVQTRVQIRTALVYKPCAPLMLLGVMSALPLK